MKMMDEIINEVKLRCNSVNNFFGIGSYQHIESVAKNAVELAEIYQADTEICEIAGWLHDIASITDYNLYDEHHIHGANIAEELLKKYEYPIERIEIVKNCILNHRGSIPSAKLSIEEKCVADADAVSHFDTLPSLFYLVYVQRKLSIEDGILFIHEKLERSFNKMSDKTKLHYENKKKMAYAILGIKSEF